MSRFGVALIAIPLVLVTLGCEATDRPDVPLAPATGGSVTPQSTDLAVFVSNLVVTQTLENNVPAKIDSVLFGNTQDPHAFDELFAE